MPIVQTKFFGDLDYGDEAIFRFPAGLPGFEDHHDFVFLRKPGLEPLMFLQSRDTRNLCFILLPIFAIDKAYRLELTLEEISEIGLAVEHPPVIGADILCAAMVSGGEGTGATANLMAPIVVNLHNNTGMQVIHPETCYSHRHPLLPAESLPPC
jgi:flagellar assembly factor FliW